MVFKNIKHSTFVPRIPDVFPRSLKVTATQDLIGRDYGFTIPVLYPILSMCGWAIIVAYELAKDLVVASVQRTNSAAVDSGFNDCTVSVDFKGLHNIITVKFL